MPSTSLNLETGTATSCFEESASGVVTDDEVNAFKDVLEPILVLSVPAMTPEGQQKPRQKSEICRTGRALTSRLMQGIPADTTIGVAVPGSISPHTGLMQNANSTWLNGRPFRPGPRSRASQACPACQ